GTPRKPTHHSLPAAVSSFTKCPYPTAVTGLTAAVGARIRLADRTAPKREVSVGYTGSLPGHKGDPTPAATLHPALSRLGPCSPYAQRCWKGRTTRLPP